MKTRLRSNEQFINAYVVNGIHFALICRTQDDAYVSLSCIYPSGSGLYEVQFDLASSRVRGIQLQPQDNDRFPIIRLLCDTSTEPHEPFINQSTSCEEPSRVEFSIEYCDDCLYYFPKDIRQLWNEYYITHRMFTENSTLELAAIRSGLTLGKITLIGLHSIDTPHPREIEQLIVTMMFELMVSRYRTMHASHNIACT